MIERGLRGVRLVVGDRRAGLVSTVNSMPPGARYQRCMVHFMRNVLSRVSRKHAAWAAGALKAVFAMESRQAALEKAEQVATEMESKGLKAAASCLREGISESTARSAGAPEWSAASRTAGARSCSSAPGSATSPPTNGAHTATWTCPGSTASCNQPTEVIPPTTDQATFAQNIGHNRQGPPMNLVPSRKLFLKNTGGNIKVAAPSL